MLKRLFGKWMRQEEPAVTPKEPVKSKDDTVIYNDPVPKGFLTNEHLPDIIFERDVMLYNAGIDPVKNVYRVIATPKVKCKNV